MIRVGTAGWDYPDWQGVVFPKPKPKGFDPLAYLAGYFSTIEINATFYRPAAAKVAASWADRVQDNPDFRFTAKLWRRFTHERATAWTAEEVTAAREALDVLHERQRLGAVLLQFPWSFRKDDTNQEWLRDLFAAFGAPAAGAGGPARQLERARGAGVADREGRRPGQPRPAAVLELDPARGPRHLAGGLRPPARAQLQGVVPQGGRPRRALRLPVHAEGAGPLGGAHPRAASARRRTSTPSPTTTATARRPSTPR